MKMQRPLHVITTKVEGNIYQISKLFKYNIYFSLIHSILVAFAWEFISNAGAANLERESGIVCTIHRRVGSHSHSFHLILFCDSIIGKSRQIFYGYKSITGHRGYLKILNPLLSCKIKCISKYASVELI